MHSSEQVDPQATGRQLGALSMGSVNGLSIHSARSVPYAQIARGQGRTIVIVAHAGNDDINAALVIAELMREIQPDTVHGRIRLVSTLAPSLALEEEIRLRRTIIDNAIAGADLVIELGGELAHWDWCGAAITHTSKTTSSSTRLAEEARVAFGAPMSLKALEQNNACSRPDICLEEEPNANPMIRTIDSVGSLASACRLRGIAHLAICTGNSVAAIERQNMLRIGCRNVLVACKVLQENLTLRSSRLFRCEVERDSVLSPAAGALHMLTSPGREVYRGDLLAHIIDPKAPWRAPVPVQVPRNGVVMACRRGTIVAPGDGIALLADEIQG